MRDVPTPLPEVIATMSRHSGGRQATAKRGAAWWLLRPVVRCAPARAGLSLVEVLVTIAIVALLVSLLLPAVQSAREAARRTECSNNLRQFGIAFASYDQHFGRLFHPDDMWPGYKAPTASSQTFYMAILPFVEQAALVDLVKGGNQAGAVPIPLFTCPTRGGAAVRGARGDFATGTHPDWVGGGYRRWYSIFGGPDTRSGSAFPAAAEVPIPGLTRVQTRDGLSQTLLLAHKSLDPRYANGETPSFTLGWAGPYQFNFDEGWASVINPRQFIQRDPAQLVQDFAGMSDALLGGPHPGASPCLFADGSMRGMAYDMSVDGGFYVLCRLWAFNDGGVASGGAGL